MYVLHIIWLACIPAATALLGAPRRSSTWRWRSPSAFPPPPRPHSFARTLPRGASWHDRTMSRHAQSRTLGLGVERPSIYLTVFGSAPQASRPVVMRLAAQQRKLTLSTRCGSPPQMEYVSSDFLPTFGDQTVPSSWSNRAHSGEKWICGGMK